MSTTRLRLDLAYDGSNFHGWAAQGGSELRTVQGVLEETLSLVLREPIQLTVAGRTDAGVHASGQVAHFDCSAAALDDRTVQGNPARLVRRLSRILPDDIRVHGVSFAPEGFDARFSALRRHYHYRITTSQPLPTRRGDTAFWPQSVDFSLLQRAADQLVGLHDFAALCKAKPHATTVRELQEFTWTDISTPAEPNLYQAHVVADAFCWSMVRSLVGTCMAIAAGKRATSFASDLLQETERSSMVPVAPACGLTLTQVDYPSDALLASRAKETRNMRK